MDTTSQATLNTGKKIPVYDYADSVTSSLSPESSSLYEDDESMITELCSCSPTASQSLLLPQEAGIADDDPDHLLPTLLLQKELSCCYRCLLLLLSLA